MSIHPNAVHWKPSMPNDFGAVTGYESEIGVTWKGADGMWHSQGAGESFGPVKTEKAARQEIEAFIRNGYVKENAAESL